jgi:predicted transposase/invertase (TIGR01784 family)
MNNPRRFYDKLVYTYIELRKFVKTDAELETDLDRWLFVLKNMSRMDKIPVYLRKPVFEKLFNIAEYSTLTKEEKMKYDSYLKYKWDNENVRAYAIKEREQAIKEAVKKGVEQGIKEAVAETRAKTVEDIAIEMKKENVSTALIAKFTKLTIEEIEKL